MVERTQLKRITVKKLKKIECWLISVLCLNQTNAYGYSPIVVENDGANLMLIGEYIGSVF